MRSVGTEMPNEVFSERLRELLRERFGRVPSAAGFAREFNNVDGWRKPISSETARRWIRGLAMPSFQRLGTLCALLECGQDDFQPDLQRDGDSPLERNGVEGDVESRRLAVVRERKRSREQELRLADLKREVRDSIRFMTPEAVEALAVLVRLAMSSASPLLGTRNATNGAVQKASKKLLQVGGGGVNKSTG